MKLLEQDSGLDAVSRAEVDMRAVAVAPGFPKNIRLAQHLYLNRELGQLAFTERVLAQAEKVIATARRHQLLVSIPIRAPEDVAYWISRDMKMLTLATDGSFFTLGANLFFKEIAAQVK